jgi:hypothetical protein
MRSADWYNTQDFNGVCFVLLDGLRSLAIVHHTNLNLHRRLHNVWWLHHRGYMTNDGCAHEFVGPELAARECLAKARWNKSTRDNVCSRLRHDRSRQRQLTMYRQGSRSVVIKTDRRSRS